MGERSLLVFDGGLDLGIELSRNFSMAPPSVQVKIVVTDGTTYEMLRKVIPLALKWRDVVLDLQGPTFNFRTHERFLDKCDRSHIDGRSYTELARDLNQRIAESVAAWVSYVKRTGLTFDGTTYTSVSSLAAEVDRRHLGDVRLSEGEAYKRDMLLLFDWIDECLRPLASFFPEAEGSAILLDAVEQIEAGHDAFLPDCPIDREKMISVLRTWRRSPKGRAAHRRALSHAG
jgi:hypothetical protein